MRNVPRVVPVVAVLSGLIAATGAALARQQQTFRAGAHTVAIYATVTDASGALVTSLDERDFEIEDDGRRRPITVFKKDLQPITVAVLLDRSPSLFAPAIRTQNAVIDFVRRLLPDDRATLGFFSHVVTLTPDLTNDADALIRRLGADAPFPAGTALWDAIEAGRAAVSEQPERRVVLVVTDAADNCSASDIDEVRRRLQADGVMVYGVGVRGREGLQTSEMRAITRAAGGWYFELRPADDPAAAMQRIADELHRQYVLGFSPAELDGRVHRLDVKVRRPGLVVRARRAYVATPSGQIR
jgi:Ca-activated chloride channel homolog